MLVKIAVSDEVLELAERFTDVQRQAIEDSKRDNAVDEIIGYACETQSATRPGIGAVYTEEKRAEVGKAILESVDVALAALALAENIEEVEHIKRLSVLLGRQHKAKVAVDVTELWPALRAAFVVIAEEFKTHAQIAPNTDRAFVRRKIKAAIMIVDDWLNNKRTRL